MIDPSPTSEEMTDSLPGHLPSEDSGYGMEMPAGKRWAGAGHTGDLPPWGATGRDRWVRKSLPLLEKTQHTWGTWHHPSL